MALTDAVALVTGASREAGRGIALELGSGNRMSSVRGRRRRLPLARSRAPARGSLRRRAPRPVRFLTADRARIGDHHLVNIHSRGSPGRCRARAGSASGFCPNSRRPPRGPRRQRRSRFPRPEAGVVQAARRVAGTCLRKRLMPSRLCPASSRGRGKIERESHTEPPDLESVSAATAA